MGKEDISLHPEIRLTFDSAGRAFGPGTVELLREIDRCGNVRKACESCGFSYSKGWTILRRCEEKTGYRIVERQAGGQSGGSAAVTEDGYSLLAVYDELRSRLKAVAEEQFEELMKEHGLCE